MLRTVCNDYFAYPCEKFLCEATAIFQIHKARIAVCMKLFAGQRLRDYSLKPGHISW